MKKAIKEKIVIGIKFNEGVLLSSANLEQIVEEKKKKEDLGDFFRIHLDYETYRKLKYLDKEKRESKILLPGKSERKEIKPYLIYDRYSEDEKEFIERYLLASVVLNSEKDQINWEKKISSVAATLKATYESISTKQIAKELSEIISQTGTSFIDETEDDFDAYYDQSFENFKGVIVLAGQDYVLTAVGKDGKMYGDAPFLVCTLIPGIFQAAQEKIYKNIENFYDKRLNRDKTLNYIKRLFKKNFNKNNFHREIAIIDKKGVEFIDI